MDHIGAIRRFFEQTPGARLDPRRWPTRTGEYWICCPFHGERTPSFSFSERGFNCFGCGSKGSLAVLCERLGIVSENASQTRQERQGTPLPVRTIKRATETNEPPFWASWRVTERFPLTATARAYYHGRGFTDATIERWQLGAGILPLCRVTYPRAILPVFAGGKLVGLRGRKIDPNDPEPKWMQSAGSTSVLFGADNLRAGAVVIVTEAPYSAILAMQEDPEIVAVAPSNGARNWRPEFTDRIRVSAPHQVIVWYDNDEAGQMGGIRVANDLLGHGVRAQIYRWPNGTAPKADLADVVTGAA